MKYHHYIYGLNISSDINFPELIIGEGLESDITLKFGRLNLVLEESVKTDQDLGFWMTPNKVAVVSQQMGQFLVSNGNEIIIDPSPATDEQAIRSLVLDILLPAILHQRNFLLLHASAVACGGAIAFIGPSGTGKSTMAMAMHTYRHQSFVNGEGSSGIFTDDMVAIKFDAAGNPLVLPGFLQLKFLPETIQGIKHLKDKISSETDPLTQKHICSESSYFAKKALPLKKIYLLTENPEVSIESVSPQECFRELMHNSYAPGLLASRKTSAEQFYQYMRLAQKVSICRLKRPKSFSILPELVELVEKNSL